MRIDAMIEVSQIYQANGKVKKTGSTQSVVTRDSVEISSFGRELQVAKQAVAQAPDIREEKVEELKNSIANGTYSVPMGALADKLLNGFTV